MAGLPGTSSESPDEVGEQRVWPSAIYQEAFPHPQDLHRKRFGAQLAVTRHRQPASGSDFTRSERNIQVNPKFSRLTRVNAYAAWNHRGSGGGSVVLLVHDIEILDVEGVQNIQAQLDR
jgi:hypothetical protein